MLVICNQITNCSTIKRDTTYLLLTTSFICWRCSWYFVDHHHNRPVKKLTSVIPNYQLTRLALIQHTACSCLLFCILVVPLLKSSLHDGVLKHRSSPWKVQIPVASNWCSFPSYVTTSVGNIRWQSVIFCLATKSILGSSSSSYCYQALPLCEDQFNTATVGL